MRSRGYFYGGITTSLNILLYALTFGHFLWLEGRVRHGVPDRVLHVPVDRDDVLG